MEIFSFFKCIFSNVYTSAFKCRPYYVLELVCSYTEKLSV